MSEQSTAQASQHSQSQIVQDLVEAGKKAFDPSLDATSRENGVNEYNQLVERTPVWILLPALNTLIKPGVLPTWLSQPMMQTLTLLPLRPNGVRGTMEFVFSVHPSSSSQPPDPSAPQKQGASITHEGVALATKLLSSVPASMTEEAWFRGISGQLFDLIDGSEGPDLSRIAAQVVGFGILGKKRLGAPGTLPILTHMGSLEADIFKGALGWEVFAQPLLNRVNPSLRSGSSTVSTKYLDAEVIDLSQDKVLVSSESLETTLRRLKVLILSNPSPGLCRRILKPILAQIWALASWTKLSAEADVRSSATLMLETYLKLFGNNETVSSLIENVLCKGSLPDADIPWEYRLTSNGNADVITKRAASTSRDLNVDWSEVEEKAGLLADMVDNVCADKDVSTVFLDLLQRWIQTTTKSSDISLPGSLKREESDSPIQELFKVTVLQKLLEKAPKKLVSRFDQLLDLVSQVLRADSQSTLSDDLIGVVLSLLNLVVTAPSFKKTDIKKEELETIETSLERLSKSERSQVSQTASNMALLLRYRGDLDEDEEPTSSLSSRQIEDRRTYNLAMSYITGPDNPPPVISEGLSLLSGLVLAGSSALDVTAVNVLMCNLLTNSEDYINLRVVKLFTQLANRHPKSTVKELLDHYLDGQEKASTDTRLRFGEALVQVIERLGETFTGDAAKQTGETLLSIAGRRSYRPKTQKKQAREEKLREMKKKKGEDIDEDEDVDMDGDMTEEDKVTNDILAQIVQGWDSKRGAEDVRMRASALSIFGTALETNIGGIGPTLASGGVDLCVNVLALEPEMEKGILRRAAIVAVLSFVKALQKAKDAGRSLGFGLTDSSREDIIRTLQYVAGTDKDGLVQQHANDVVESLENWHISSILPAQETEPPGLGSLAGLTVNPEGSLVDAGGRTRPRIEEVE